MTEREALAKTIGRFKARDTYHLVNEDFLALIAAAEKHLATLPRTKEVQLWPATWAAFVRGEWVVYSYLATSESDAADAVARTRVQGINNAPTIHPPIVQVVPDEQ